MIQKYEHKYYKIFQYKNGGYARRSVIKIAETFRGISESKIMLSYSSFNVDDIYPW